MAGRVERPAIVFGGAMKAIIISFCNVMTEGAKFLLGFCVAAIVLITLAAVWQRYVMGNPLSWIEQVSNMFFVWIVFPRRGRALPAKPPYRGRRFPDGAQREEPRHLEMGDREH